MPAGLLLENILFVLLSEAILYIWHRLYYRIYLKRNQLLYFVLSEVVISYILGQIIIGCNSVVLIKQETQLAATVLAVVYIF